jgi:hypothetical protein
VSVVDDAWAEALRAAYAVAKGERAAVLRGRYLKSRDDRGMHPFSHECGRIAALEGLEPALALAGFNPVELRRAAEADAYDEFVNDLMEAAA